MNVWDLAHEIAESLYGDAWNRIVEVERDGLDLRITDEDGDVFIVAIDTAVDG